MIETLNDTINTPKLGEGVFLATDIAQILSLPYQKVRYSMNGFWDTFSFGDKNNKAVNFYTLVEFYTFYQLRSKGVSAQQIKKAHCIIAQELKTKYPFAHAISTDGKNIWYDLLGNLIKADGKKQLDLKKILLPFLHKIEFGDNDIAARLFPLPKSKNIVVDPKRQFGQPTISGKNISISTIKKLYDGGETKEYISNLYDLKASQVNDALKYYKRTA